MSNIREKQRSRRDNIAPVSPVDKTNIWDNKKGEYCCPVENIFPSLTETEQDRAMDMIKTQQEYFKNQTK